MKSQSVHFNNIIGGRFVFASTSKSTTVPDIIIKWFVYLLNERNDSDVILFNYIELFIAGGLADFTFYFNMCNIGKLPFAQ